MTEQKNQLASLFAACWKDEALKARFMSDPKAVLAEYDMPVPDGMDVKVVENADNCVHITMPAPPSGSNELSDEELSHAAGGAIEGLAAPRTNYGSVACERFRPEDEEDI
jgi:hypothetical protein